MLGGTYNQYRHLTNETLIVEALRIAALEKTSGETSHMLHELSDRLAMLDGYRRGYFDALHTTEDRRGS